MHIYYAGQIIPTEVFNEHYDELKQYSDNAGNVFYNAFIEGLIKNGCIVRAVGAGSKYATENYKVNIDGFDFKFRYFGSGAKKTLKLLSSTYKEMKSWSKTSDDDKLMLFDALRITQVAIGTVFCRIHGIKKIAVVTDVPGYRVTDRKNMSPKSKLIDSIGRFFISKFDGYVLLSEEMLDVINIGKKPYTVIEGMCADDDIDVKYKKDDKFTVMYAGSLMKKYNIANLIDAVIELENKNVVLKLFGNGEMVSKIEEIAKKHDCIKYYGTVSNARIIEEEKKAWLLVNPRSSAEEYTKYSFPSKNIEYMRSGTPVLYTKLKSMPKEYYEYINIIEDESLQGIRSAIEKVVDGDYQEYESKATLAKKFIRENKSAVKQTKKALELFYKVK